ncbi:MAG: hypothetical protein GY869_08295 [Planctomycetes bacterium]|nr:hypothetical protein [Planctomycetota bacterium]
MNSPPPNDNPQQFFTGIIPPLSVYLLAMTDILALFMCLGLGELVLIILVTIIIVLFAVHRKKR